jgi:hypothetical protein
MLGLFSSCALFSHKPAGHISVKAVSWKLVKKYAEPEAGLAGHKITIIDPSDHRIVAEKLTDNLGYAMFDVPAGSYTEWASVVSLKMSLFRRVKPSGLS